MHTEAHTSQHQSTGSSNFHEFSGTRGTGRGGEEGGRGGGREGVRGRREVRENLTTSMIALLTCGKDTHTICSKNLSDNRSCGAPHAHFKQTLLGLRYQNGTFLDAFMRERPHISNDLHHDMRHEHVNDLLSELVCGLCLLCVTLSL